jgi:hypothetical protein
MYPGLKLKLNRNDMDALRVIIQHALQEYKCDPISAYACKDFSSEFILSLAKKIVANGYKVEYTITLKPLQIWCFKSLLSNVNSLPPMSYEYNLLLRLCSEIDRFSLKCKNLQLQ